MSLTTFNLSSLPPFFANIGQTISSTISHPIMTNTITPILLHGVAPILAAAPLITRVSCSCLPNSKPIDKLDNSLHEKKWLTISVISSLFLVIFCSTPLAFTGAICGGYDLVVGTTEFFKKHASPSTPAKFLKSETPKAPVSSPDQAKTAKPIESNQANNSKKNNTEDPNPTLVTGTLTPIADLKTVESSQPITAEQEQESMIKLLPENVQGYIPDSVIPYIPANTEKNRTKAAIYGPMLCALETSNLGIAVGVIALASEILSQKTPEKIQVLISENKNRLFCQGLVVTGLLINPNCTLLGVTLLTMKDEVKEIAKLITYAGAEKVKTVTHNCFEAVIKFADNCRQSEEIKEHAQFPITMYVMSMKIFAFCCPNDTNRTLTSHIFNPILSRAKNYVVDPVKNYIIEPTFKYWNNLENPFSFISNFNSDDSDVP